jgi:hypothetical protein
MYKASEVQIIKGEATEANIPETILVSLTLCSGNCKTTTFISFSRTSRLTRAGKITDVQDLDNSPRIKTETGNHAVHTYCRFVVTRYAADRLIDS